MGFRRAGLKPMQLHWAPAPSLGPGHGVWEGRSFFQTLFELENSVATAYKFHW